MEFSEAVRARVLLVDGDTVALEGLCSYLHRARRSWEVEIVRNPGAALVALSERYVDVLVSDLRMPEVDGTPFLKEARSISPHTLRIVLSGRAEEGELLSVDAHRLLPRPCCKEELLGVLEDACHVAEVAEAPDLVRAMGMSTVLPTAATVRRKLAAALAGPGCDLEELGDVVESDPGLAARLLALSNSRLFGATGSVSSVREAAAVLGSGTLRAIALDVGVEGERAADGDRSAFSTARLQRHAHLSSELTRLLLGCTEGRAEVAATAALFQHCGRTIVAQNCQQEAEQITRRLRAGVDLDRLEREVLGCSQAELGRALLLVRGIPRELGELVRAYPRPESTGEGFGAAHAIHVASALAADVLGARDEVSSSLGPSLDARTFQAWGFTDSLEQWKHTAEGILRSMS